MDLVTRLMRLENLLFPEAVNRAKETLVVGRKPTVKGGKLQILSLRTTTALRRTLEGAAKANGRSLSAEVEERLVLSCHQDRMLSLLRQELAALRPMK